MGEVLLPSDKEIHYQWLNEYASEIEMNELKTLNLSSQGSSAIIITINSASKEMSRLEAHGIHPGAEVDILSHSGGTMLIGTGEGRVVIDTHLAAQIQVM